MRPSTPWYREPWPWILMSGPAAVLVAGVFTTWIAVATRDPLVADDYYKRGLAIDRELGRERAAERLGLSARIEVQGDAIQVRLEGKSAPEALFLSLAHPTRAELDQRIRLARNALGVYEASLAAPLRGRWRYVLEDARGTWRLAGLWQALR